MASSFLLGLFPFGNKKVFESTGQWFSSHIQVFNSGGFKRDGWEKRPNGQGTYPDCLSQGRVQSSAYWYTQGIVQPSPLILEHYHSLKKKACTHEQSYPPLPPPPPPSPCLRPWQPLIYFLFLWICLFLIFLIHGIITCGLL